MKYTFYEFNSIHKKRHVNNGLGWYNACLTMDGRFRPDKSVRVPPDSDDVTLGNDPSVDAGQTSGNLQRLPQTLLIPENFTHRSIVARITASQSQKSRDVPDFMRWNGAIELYANSRMLHWCIVQWKINTKDPMELILRMSKPCMSRSEFTARMLSNSPSVQTMQRFDRFKYPVDGTTNWFLEFLTHNEGAMSLIWEEILASTSTSVRVPILRPPESKLTSGWYSPKTPGDLFLQKKDGNACICTGSLCVTIEPVVHIVRRHPVDKSRYTVMSNTLARVLHVAYTGNKCTATLETGAIEWLVPCRPITTITLQTYIHSLIDVHESAGRHDNSTPGILRLKNSLRTPTRALCIKVKSYTLQGAGFVFTTDAGLTTGVPHMHTKTRTACLDAIQLPATHRNVLARVIHVQLEHDIENHGRSVMCTLLNKLLELHTDTAALPEFVVFETRDIVWRAQLAIVFKAFPLYSKLYTPPEFTKLLSSPTSLALTPDLKFVRVKGQPSVLPILDITLHAEMAFISANDLFAARYTFEDITQLLEPHARCKNMVKLRVNEDGFVVCVSPITRAQWSPSVIFQCNGTILKNTYRQISLSTSDFTVIKRANVAIPIALGSQFLGFVNNSVYNNPLSLAISERPVYMCTGQLDRDLMIRSVPTRDEINEMLHFCEHEGGHQLFANVT